MTSSDVLDTSIAMQMVESADLLERDLEALREAIKAQALRHKMTPCMGRSHGVHAEPVTFGLKMAVWYCEVNRALERLALARKQMAFGQISGAVGTCAHLPPDIEEEAMEILCLKVDPVSTQIIQRDRHAFFLSTLAVIAASCEKMATEIRNLQRTEILEVEEFFSEKQKGSSAMPHKRNPITAEQVAGLARVIRSNSLAGLENVTLWHERDLTHSSVERVIIPDSCILLDYILTKLTGVISKLLVYPENMQANIDRSYGLIYSQNVLLALTGAGITREEAYLLVQRNAMRAWKEKTDFPTLVRADRDIKKLLKKSLLDNCFDQNDYFKHIDHLFHRAGLED
jgi:adenylosuccinate lyase